MKRPLISGADAVKALRKIAYEFDEQEGSHMIVRHRAEKAIDSQSQGTRQKEHSEL